MNRLHAAYITTFQVLLALHLTIYITHNSVASETPVTSRSVKAVKYSPLQQKEVEQAEFKTEESIKALNNIRQKAGLRPFEIMIPSLLLKQGGFSTLWNDWIRSKAHLANREQRLNTANSMTDEELAAAAKLYPITAQGTNYTHLNTAQELLNTLAVEKAIATQNKSVLERELGITNDLIAIDSETLKTLSAAHWDLSIKYNVEMKLKRRIESEQHPASPKKH